MYHRIFYFMADDANVIGFFLSYGDDMNMCVIEFPIVDHVNVHFKVFSILW